MKDEITVSSSYDGTKIWRKGGARHRTDGPALIKPNGTMSWWIDGELHRTDGPAVITVGTQEWWANGKLHREDGPAIIGNNCEEWWVNGKRHRLDGPAVLIGKNQDLQYWYINDVSYTQKIITWMNNKNYHWSKDHPWDDDIKTDFLLTFQM